jgi:hypothetical protein
MAEYWLAARFGGVWLRPRLKTALRGVPAICDSVARGEQVPAGKLLSAQQFSGRVWWGFGLCALVLNFPLIGLLAAVNPSSAVLSTPPGSPSPSRSPCSA